MTRRNLLATTLAATPAFAAPAAPKVRLGCDLFSIRSQGWTPFQMLDYCSKFGVQVVHFSEVRFVGSLDPENLKRVREHARRLNIDVELGMRSLCPTSKMFDPSLGTAEEQLQKMIAAAVTLGSPIVRAVLGSMADRVGPIPLEGHIENLVKVLRSQRSRVMDAGLKVAIENHAGDMQARELKGLIEAAGPEFVGACLDSGNPCWTLEDPHLTLDTLAPYVLTSHVRDSAVWRTPEGCNVAWVRMGEGNVDIASYVKKYAEKCPGRPLSLEVIVTGPRPFPYHDPKFWEAYKKTPAWEFARFVAIADRGTAPAPLPKMSKEEQVEKERLDLEASLTYTKNLLSTLS